MIAIIGTIIMKNDNNKSIQKFIFACACLSLVLLVIFLDIISSPMIIQITKLL